MKKKQKFTSFSLFTSIVAAIGGLLFGYNTSVISGALLFLKKSFGLSTFNQEMLVSIVLIGALLGACFGGLITDKLGRKFTLFFTSILFIIGTFVAMNANSINILLLGRMILGFAVGIVSLATPLYISEMSDPQHRGALVSLNQFAVTIGILLAYIINYSFAIDGNWRAMFAFALIPAFALFILLFFVPETPTFLATHGKKKKALKILSKILIDTKNSEISNIENNKEKKAASWSHLFSKSVRPALFIGIGISVFQQITGINIVIYYAPTIFQLAGFESAPSAILASMGIGTINVIMTFIALWLIDLVGRKPLLKVGISGMVISLTVLGFAFLAKGTLVSMVSVVSLMAYVAFFAIGLGPIVWLIISEIYPMGIRGRAMGIATFANWTTNYIITLSFLTLIEILGKSFTFWLYAFIGIIALWFVIKKVPETKGKSLKEIQKFFKNKNI
ncbi:MAG: Arabinose-proton symporter [Candidatus Anoxychlamydiales bacterium]|nr:Arabinose-proton symporter [Candidatus Anoxychlamydiales bacterium]